MSNIAAPEPIGASTSEASQPLQVAAFPLWGSRLIEASAGTGKTWTIAALYLRLILGHGGEQGFERALRPGDILVMTFTRAATRELSDRTSGFGGTAQTMPRIRFWSHCWQTMNRAKRVSVPPGC